MEFSFDCATLLGCHEQDGIAIIDAANPPKYVKPGGGFSYNAHRSSSNFMGGSQGTNQNLQPQEQLEEIINQMGQASAKA